MKVNLILCSCDTCGNQYEVFYNIDKDCYICYDCIANNEDEDEEEELSPLTELDYLEKIGEV